MGFTGRIVWSTGVVPNPPAAALFAHLIHTHCSHLEAAWQYSVSLSATPSAPPDDDDDDDEAVRTSVREKSNRLAWPCVRKCVDKMSMGPLSRALSTTFASGVERHSTLPTPHTRTLSALSTTCAPTMRLV